MCMLSFICVIVCALFEWKKISAGFVFRLFTCIAVGDPGFVYRLFTCIGVGDPVINRGCDSINRFNPATFVCLFHASR